MEDFKIVNNTIEIEAKCQVYGCKNPYIHISKHLPNNTKDITKVVSDIFTSRYKCYSGHKAFLNTNSKTK